MLESYLSWFQKVLIYLLIIVSSDFMDIWRSAEGEKKEKKMDEKSDKNIVFWLEIWEKDLQIATPSSLFDCFSWKLAQRYFSRVKRNRWERIFEFLFLPYP